MKIKMLKVFLETLWNSLKNYKILSCPTTISYNILPLQWMLIHSGICFSFIPSLKALSNLISWVIMLNGKGLLAQILHSWCAPPTRKELAPLFAKQLSLELCQCSLEMSMLVFSCYRFPQGRLPLSEKKHSLRAANCLKFVMGNKGSHLSAGWVSL